MLTEFWVLPTRKIMSQREKQASQGELVWKGKSSFIYSTSINCPLYARHCSRHWEDSREKNKVSVLNEQIHTWEKETALIKLRFVAPQGHSETCLTGSRTSRKILGSKARPKTNWPSFPQTFIHSFIHLHLLSTYYVLSTILAVEIQQRNKRSSQLSWSFHYSVRDRQ